MLHIQSIKIPSRAVLNISFHIYFLNWFWRHHWWNGTVYILTVNILGSIQVCSVTRSRTVVCSSINIIINMTILKKLQNKALSESVNIWTVMIGCFSMRNNTIMKIISIQQKWLQTLLPWCYLSSWSRSRDFLTMSLDLM